MRQIYTTENFDKNKYNDVYNMSTKINKCAINTTFVILDRLANGEYNVAVMEASELYYLEQAEAAYDNHHHYANETQKAIEGYDIMEWMKDYKKGKNDSEKY